MLYALIILIPVFEQIIIWLLLAILGVYIWHLHLRLSKSELFIHSLGEAIQKIDPTLNYEDVFSFLRKLGQMEIGGRIEEHIFDPTVMNFMFDDERSARTFLHYTRERDIADRILKEGFFFSDSFHKTAESVYNDRIDLAYKHNDRKTYGNYAMVISIPVDAYNAVEKSINQRPSDNFLVEHILSKSCSENDYLLPNKYLKGYIDISSGELVSNPNFESRAKIDQQEQ